MNRENITHPHHYTTRNWREGRLGVGRVKWYRCSCESAQKLSKHTQYQKARQLCAPYYLGSSLIPLLKCDKNCSLPCRYCPEGMSLQEKWLVWATAPPVPASLHPPGPLQPSGELSQELPFRHHIPHGASVMYALDPLTMPQSVLWKPKKEQSDTLSIHV